MPVAEFEANLIAAIEIMARNADIVLIGTPPRYFQGWYYAPDASVTNSYRDAVKRVVTGLNLPNVRLVNVSDEFEVRDEIVLEDAIHFSVKGLEESAALFREQL